METNKIYVGNCLDVLKTFPDESIDCVVTSPPYWKLREYEGIPDYIWDGNPDCEHEWESSNFSIHSGSTKSEKEDGTGRITNAVSENSFCVKCNAWKGQLGLEPTFELYLNHLWQIMDETYRVLKSTGTVWINLGDTYAHNRGSQAKNGLAKVNTQSKGMKLPDGIKEKCLLLIPSRFAIGCMNRGWIVRNDIIWAKPNAMPESVKDRLSKKYEHVFFMAKSEDYYFDLDSIRDKCNPLNRWGGQKLKAKGTSEWDKATGQKQYRDRDMQPNNGMKNPGDVTDFWKINTKSSMSKHYATYNVELITKPILSGCPENGIVLDPFAGTGTTMVRAIELGRQAIGIDGSDQYIKIAYERFSEMQKELNKNKNAAKFYKIGA